MKKPLTRFLVFLFILASLFIVPMATACTKNIPPHMTNMMAKIPAPLGTLMRSMELPNSTSPIVIARLYPPQSPMILVAPTDMTIPIRNPEYIMEITKAV